jgi:hypothetical protein
MLGVCCASLLGGDQDLSQAIQQSTIAWHWGGPAWLARAVPWVPSSLSPAQDLCLWTNTSERQLAKTVPFNLR